MKFGLRIWGYCSISYCFLALVPALTWAKCRTEPFYESGTYKGCTIIYEALSFLDHSISEGKCVDSLCELKEVGALIDAVTVVNRSAINETKSPSHCEISPQNVAQRPTLEPSTKEDPRVGSSAKHREFIDIIDPKTLEAEQVLFATQPLGINPRDYLGLVFKSASNTGAIPEMYSPEKRNTFPVKTVLIPIEEAILENVDETALKEPFIFSDDGKKYIRFFIHPVAEEYYSKLLSRYTAKDPEGPWLATPSSSPRSLYIADRQGVYKPFIGKLSIPTLIAGTARFVSKAAIKRAVTSTRFLAELQKRTGGKISDTDKGWELYSESLGVTPKAENLAGMIFREIPDSNKDHTFIPWYALVSNSKQGRWIDKLFSTWKGSNPNGMKSEFVWAELLKPLLALHTSISMDNGLTTEFHPQNIMLKIDKSNRVVGLVLKDMDSFWYDQSLRKNRLQPRGLMPRDSMKMDQEAASIFKYNEAQQAQAESYINVIRDKTIARTLQFFLSKNDLESALSRSDQFVKLQFYERFARDLPEVSDFKSVRYQHAWDLLHKKYTTEEEAELYRASPRHTGRRRSPKQKIIEFGKDLYEGVKKQRAPL